MGFIVTDINVVPQDTGVNQYINIEVQLLETTSDYMYSRADGETEIFAGEGVGLL